MTIIVEDGSNVANANSYVSLTDLRSYALARGVTLSAVDATLESQVFKAMDYIESFRSRFQGVKSYQSPTYVSPQLLQFPRSEFKDSQLGIYIDCNRIDFDVIPTELINIECQCVMAINAGVNFANFTQSQQFVIKEKIGPLETEYAKPSEGGYQGGVPYIESIQNMFDVLFYPCGNNGSTMTSRW